MMPQKDTKMDSINTLTLAHGCARQRVHPGDLCIDATAGRGQDTALLCELVGPTGRVLSFDIQEDAVQSTRARLKERGLDEIGTVILDSHANMDKYADPDSVDMIVFNFGYLPGGNRQLFTLADSSCEAITKGLALLKKSGIMCLSLYYGGPNGYSERDAILELVKTFDPKICTVIVCDFANRKADSPFPIFIIKGAY
jgi:hypothetical protein